MTTRGKALLSLAALVVASCWACSNGQSAGPAASTRPTATAPATKASLATSPTTVPASPALLRPLVRPSALAVGPDRTLYVSDPGAHRVVAVAADGAVRVAAAVDQPSALALDDAGSLYVADDRTDTDVTQPTSPPS